MAVLELLAASARTRVVASRELVLNQRSVVLFDVLASVVVSGSLLCRVVEFGLLLSVLLALCTLLGSCLAHLLLLLHFRNLSACEDRSDAVVHVVHHRVEELSTLELEDEQRVLLLVRSVLHAMAQLVELAKVLLPAVVDDVEHDDALELLNNVATLCAVSLLEVARNVVNALAVGDRHHDALVDSALVLLNLLDDRPSNALDAVGLALEGSHCALESTLLKLVVAYVLEVLLAERTLHSQNLEEVLAASGVVVCLDDVHYAVPDDVGDVHADTLAHECVAALLVDYGALLVHHVVVLEQVLTYTEVVLLNLLLCAFDALRDHRVLDTVALLEAETVHEACDAL